MGQILFAGGGGGAVTSDELSAKKEWVLSGKTYMGNDTDDDAGTGTMANIAALDAGPSLTMANDNVYCRMHYGAHITNADSGYPEVYYSKAAVRSAINYTDASKVLNDTTICGMTGTMPNRGKYQYSTYFGSSNDGSNDYVAFNNLPAGYYGPSEGGWAPEIRMIRSVFKQHVIDYFGIGSVTNFSVAQYSSLKLQFTWANPSSGKMWSGIRIVGKKGSYPSNVSDGSVFYDSANQSYITGELSAGAWYFRAWNYVTTSSERWYNTYSEASITNKAIGDLKFYSGTTFTIPDGVTYIQYFLVGGGGGGMRVGGGSSDSSEASGGGGGGYTTSGYANVTPGSTITINIGSGGGGVSGSAGSATSLSGAVTASAGGGNGGKATGYGGNGGSGGGAGNRGGTAGDGGSDGSNGGNVGSKVSSGQGSSTRCPWDTNSLYAGGGGGGSGSSYVDYGRGGDGGGGAGGGLGSAAYDYWPSDGQGNTGGGGGGNGCYGGQSRNSGSGGSGLVRIRYGW